MSCIDNYNYDYRTGAENMERVNKEKNYEIHLKSQDKWFDKDGNFKAKYVEK